MVFHGSKYSGPILNKDKGIEPGRIVYNTLNTRPSGSAMQTVSELTGIQRGALMAYEEALHKLYVTGKQYNTYMTEYSFRTDYDAALKNAAN